MALAPLALAPLALMAYKDGPPANSTGGFGERSCHACHLDHPLNAEGGKLTVTGIPDSYAPGQPYRITVTISRTELARGGFQISSRFADGKPAGTWGALDRRAQVAEGFAQHTSAGSVAVSAGSNSWTLEWTAPAGEAVQFHAAANASNDDASPLGDFIYVAEYRAAP